MSKQACIYRLESGPYFYVGSTLDARRRKLDHQWRLKAGIHSSKRLQDHFNECGEARFIPLLFARKIVTEDDAAFRERVRAMEQGLLDACFSDPNCENQSPNSKGPNSRHFKTLWQDPDYRAWMTRLAKERVVSAESREKMAAAKRGARNPKARVVIVTKPDGSEERFESTTAAARFFGVSQQLFEQWVKGLLPWPGRGKYVRRKYEWIAPYSARFEDLG